MTINNSFSFSNLILQSIDFLNVSYLLMKKGLQPTVKQIAWLFLPAWLTITLMKIAVEALSWRFVHQRNYYSTNISWFHWIINICCSDRHLCFPFMLLLIICNKQIRCFRQLTFPLHRVKLPLTSQRINKHCHVTCNRNLIRSKLTKYSSQNTVDLWKDMLTDTDNFPVQYPTLEDRASIKDCMNAIMAYWKYI